MQYWIVRTEPIVYSWATFIAEKVTQWDGVRNYAARKHMREMSVGDTVVIYHTGTERRAMGIATVIREAYPDTTALGPIWVSVDLQAKESLKNPVTLAMMRADPILQHTPLVRISRLSVFPMTEQEFKQLLTLSEGV